MATKSSALKGDPSSFMLGQPFAKSAGSRSTSHALARVSAVSAPALAADYFNSSIRAGNIDSFSNVSLIRVGGGLL